jgi:hypothetical protein
MDPLSIFGTTIAIGTLCAQIYRVLHATVETYSDCPGELTLLLTRTEGLLFQLCRLDVAKNNLSSNRCKYLERACGEKQCMETVIELNKLVWNIWNAGIGQHEKAGFSLLAQGSPTGDAANKASFLGRLRWIFVKGDAEKLALKLREHQQDISMAVSTIGMCVYIWALPQIALFLSPNIPD